jgi:hypothetical protein
MLKVPTRDRTCRAHHGHKGALIALTVDRVEEQGVDEEEGEGGAVVVVVVMRGMKGVGKVVDVERGMEGAAVAARQSLVVGLVTAMQVVLGGIVAVAACKNLLGEQQQELVVAGTIVVQVIGGLAKVAVQQGDLVRGMLSPRDERGHFEQSSVASIQVCLLNQ